MALLVFFLAVVLYISFRFEPKMALAAFIAMIHDLLITIGIYSLAGFQVTPDTVIAVLTILGYSLYDTVVVFDRVRENTKGLGAIGRMTYSDMINLSMNQTLARSINTSLVAILPVLAVLVVGAEILGATTLQDYGLALFVGLLSRGLLVDLHRLAGAGHAEGARAPLHHHPPAPRDAGRVGLLTPAAARGPRGRRRRGGSRPGRRWPQRSHPAGLGRPARTGRRSNRPGGSRPAARPPAGTRRTAAGRRDDRGGRRRRRRRAAAGDGRRGPGGPARPRAPPAAAAAGRSQAARRRPRKGSKRLARTRRSAAPAAGGPPGAPKRGEPGRVA